MFRKEEALARDWTPEKSAELSDIQKDLVLKAADMLRPGGMLLYSTCTFSPCEDEEVVAYLLRQRPDMELMEMPGYEGFSGGRPEYAGTADTSDSEIALNLNAFNPEELQKCVRIFPHKMDGEGHFLALFRKKGDSLPPVFRFSAKGPDKNTRKWLEEFFSEIGLKTIGGQEFDWNRVEVRKDKVYYQLPFPLDLRGISFLRNGLYLGDLKKNRFVAVSASGAGASQRRCGSSYLPAGFRRAAYPLSERRNSYDRAGRSRSQKRLAPSLCGRLSSRLRKACKRDPEKQISCWLESVISPPQDICPH